MHHRRPMPRPGAAVGTCADARQEVEKEVVEVEQVAGKGAVQMGAAADEHDDALEKRLQALREGAM